jgi:nemo like kinase
MPARTTGASGASTGQAILAAAQSAFFSQQHQQPQTLQQHSGSGNSAPTSEYLPDRPIGYGAFGVVWSVTDPRDSKRVALKKLPNVFQSLVSSKRVFRELKMMRFFRHENVLSCLDILQVSMINI